MGTGDSCADSIHVGYCGLLRSVLQTKRGERAHVPDNPQIKSAKPGSSGRGSQVRASEVGAGLGLFLNGWGVDKLSPGVLGLWRSLRCVCCESWRRGAEVME